jgi:hypothetical protein
MKEIKERVCGRWTSYACMNRTKKRLTIALSGVGKGLGGLMMGAM